MIAVVAPSMLSPERQAAARAGEPPCALNVYRPTVKHWNASRERVSIYLDDQSVGAPGTGVGAAPLAHSDFSTVSEAMWRSRE